jgi:hypothetical chaperone protein
VHVGIDFGTTNTVVAVVDDAHSSPRVLPIDGDARTMRTMLYVARDHATHFGAAAIRRYRERNVGRLPRFVKKYIGEIDIELGELSAKGYDLKGGAVVVDVFTDVDADSPGRLLHSLKGPLATDYTGTTIFGRDYTLEDLIAAFLEDVRRRVEEQTGRSVRRAVFGRPVHFASAENDELKNAHAQDRLEAAAHAAGFKDVQFEYEPIGACLAYAARRSGGDQRVLVFDFGGGTLDLAVVHFRADGRRDILATGGLGIAGDHFDRALFRAVMAEHFGRDVRWGQQRLPLPEHIVAALGDWQDLAGLSNAKTIYFLREAQRDCDAPIQLLALEDLIARGYAFDVYDRVERAKVELSRARAAEIAFAAGTIDVWRIAARTRFETAIAQERRAIAAAVDDVLARAGVSPSQIDHVVRTGGSSSIPCIVELLHTRFGPQKIRDEDHYTAVAAGLALRAAEWQKK